ncbi:MAG: ABC transporter permease [Bacteroidales bacterium]|jgi:putative ABC transport system permease protein|nr:ABC transporter permease [Bacteroidales bacterium]MDD2263933.1 ABC transporter permease [Bacteroidales bacterium]MDD2831167.1 ABC transporter permease [Bacteroidales bacterium]MDD3209278.1 ABC transporter permease [Bacteroidales bacterium]MDD3697595.1 ABC transporter permease [Bacteroidales bacterium]
MKYPAFLRLSPLIRENLNVSLTAVKTNKLRSVLTILMIAVGIMALVGILTAIDAIKGSVTDSFNQMGASTITIRSQSLRGQSSEVRRRIRNKPVITYQQAIAFSESYPIPSRIAIYAPAKSMLEVSYGSEKTNPDIGVMGVNPDYFPVNALELSAGRVFSNFEIYSAGFVTVVGNGLLSLFGDRNPIGEFLNVDGRRYQVIGVLRSKGASFGGGADKQLFIPLGNARSVYGGDNMNFQIKIQPLEGQNSRNAYEEAEVSFRTVRRLSPTDQTDFRIERSEDMLERSMETMRIVTIAAFIIGFITLLGAAVGLMNIMLVSVNERTREIGTRKAMGATSRIIKQQFLFEAIVIGQLGGLGGIILGILAGNLTSLGMKTPFVVPWLWMLLGVAVCFLVSILSGYIPAVRASRLDPIEALRYE